MLTNQPTTLMRQSAMMPQSAHNNVHRDTSNNTTSNCRRPTPRSSGPSSVHAPYERVDERLPVAMVAALDKVPGLLPVAAAGVAQLERPEEVVGLLEVRSNGEDLVDQVLDADDAVPAEGALDDRVLRERGAPVVDLAKATLVDELTNALQIRVAVCE